MDNGSVDFLPQMVPPHVPEGRDDILGDEVVEMAGLEVVLVPVLHTTLASQSQALALSLKRVPEAQVSWVGLPLKH